MDITFSRKGKKQKGQVMLIFLVTMVQSLIRKITMIIILQFRQS